MNTSASSHTHETSPYSSPNKFSAHRQAARADLSPIRISQLSRQQYSPRFLEEIDVSTPQKQHSSAISLYQDRLRRQEENSEKIIEALKGQVALLRRQLDTAESTHRKEVEGVMKQGESVSQKLTVTLQSLQTQVAQLTEANASIPELYLEKEHQLRSQYERELSALRSEVNSVKSELDHITSLSRADSQRLADRNQELVEQHRADLESIRRLQVEVASYRRDVETKDSAIADLRMQVNRLQEECCSAAAHKDAEMRRVKQEFADLQRSIQTQQSDFARVSAAQSHWEQEWQEWQQEQSLHEHERRRLKRENRDLQQQLARLEKLVYGKGSVRSTPSPMRCRTPLS